MGWLDRFIADVVGFEGREVVDRRWASPNGVRDKPTCRFPEPSGWTPAFVVCP